jgi:RNA polymerase sigma factor (sigma-70 family)
MSHNVTSTVELVTRAQQGDRAAVEELFTRHVRPLRRWARGRLPRWARDLSDTDDLVQEALLQTFKRIEDFEVRGVGSLQAYLRQAVLNRLRDELRRRAREPDRVELDAGSAENALPLARAVDRETRERYEQALSRLEPEEQELMVARIEMGYTYKELAVALGKPSADAARKAAKRALLRLVNEMDDGRG